MCAAPFQWCGRSGTWATVACTTSPTNTSPVIWIADFRIFAINISESVATLAIFNQAAARCTLPQEQNVVLGIMCSKMELEIVATLLRRPVEDCAADILYLSELERK